MRVLYAPNMRHVYLAGNEFGETHYIVAESFEDAYQELLHDYANRGEICDHGGEITDAQRMNTYCGGGPDGICDCAPTDDGRWVWDVYLWMNELALSVDMFLLVADDLDPRNYPEAT
jgi:hypothetical protein